MAWLYGPMAAVKFSNNSIDLQVLREFCEREGETVSYRKDVTFEAKK